MQHAGMDTKIATMMAVLMNRKICKNCLRSYSKDTVRCLLVDGTKVKTSLFAPKNTKPFYIKHKHLFHRDVGVTAKAHEEANILQLKILCVCGSMCSIEFTAPMES